MTTSHNQVKTRVPKIYLMVLEAFKTSQSPNNYASNNQLEHLKKMGISKSHDDLWVEKASHLDWNLDFLFPPLGDRPSLSYKPASENSGYVQERETGLFHL